MTRTPMATIATAAMRERLARRTAGEALRPGLSELGATWRAGRLPPGAGRAALVPRGRRVPGAEGAEWAGGAKGSEAAEGIEGVTPFSAAGPGTRLSGRSGWVPGAETPT